MEQLDSTQKDSFYHLLPKIRIRRGQGSSRGRVAAGAVTRTTHLSAACLAVAHSRGLFHLSRSSHYEQIKFNMEQLDCTQEDCFYHPLPKIRIRRGQGRLERSEYIRSEVRIERVWEMDSLVCYFRLTMRPKILHRCGKPQECMGDDLHRSLDWTVPVHEFQGLGAYPGHVAPARLPLPTTPADAFVGTNIYVRRVRDE
jgi:hypothetical protein